MKDRLREIHKIISDLNSSGRLWAPDVKDRLKRVEDLSDPSGWDTSGGDQPPPQIPPSPPEK